ncbi:MAG: phosphoglucomutase/phosphomannomutase family protein [Acidobacteriota bacterium]
MTDLRFGTSGWRGRIAEEFTAANVRRVCIGIARALQARGVSRPRLALGHDARFMASAMADEAAAALTACGAGVVRERGPLPTPALALAVVERGLDGAVNLTASHNPPEWNGVKFSDQRGGPAPTELTRQIERSVPESGSLPRGSAKGEISEADLRTPYLAVLARRVDLDLIRASGLRLGLDLAYGAARGTLDRLLSEHGIPYASARDREDPLFGGRGPDVGPSHLSDLADTVRAGRADLGLAVDGDADRFGILDRDGSFVPPNLVLMLLADAWARERGDRQGVGRSVATTHGLDAVADHWGAAKFETPVGFKYLGDLIYRGEAFFVGEESAGLSVRGHLAEKDGGLAVLLVAELMARTGRSLAELRDELFCRVGEFYSARIDVRLGEEDRGRLREFLGSPLADLGGVRVEREVRLDGAKWVAEDGSWALARPSGTEPLARIYVEARTNGRLQALCEWARGLEERLRG